MKKGAVRKDKIVAIFIRTPLSDIKNNKIAIVSIAKNEIKNRLLYL